MKIPKNKTGMVSGLMFAGLVLLGVGVEAHIQFITAIGALAVVCGGYLYFKGTEK